MSGSGREGQIITFYSYKGGVGRSMAVANVAALLAQNDKRVLVLDFDLEAPGLHRYFLNPETVSDRPRYEPGGPQSGIVDFFWDLRAALEQEFATQEEYLEEAATMRDARIRKLIEGLLKTGQYKYLVRLANPNRPAGLAELDFMPAGRIKNADYADRVRDLDWKRFYQNFSEAFPVLRDVLRAEYDFVMVDSRTGITDVGSVCTVLLPSKLVLVFSPNEQSLDGALQVGEQAARERRLAGEPPTSLFPLLSRVEAANGAAMQRWRAKVRERCETLIAELRGEANRDLELYFKRILILHDIDYAYGEQIAAEQQEADQKYSLAEAYAEFTRALMYADVVLAQDALATGKRGIPASPQHVSTERVDRRREGLLLVSIGGDSLRLNMEETMAELGLAGTDILVDFSSPQYVDPEEREWQALAQAVRHQIRRWVENPRYDRFHLFYRGPVVIAPLVGALVARNKQLLIYHFDNGKYRFAYTLDRRFIKST